VAKKTNKLRVNFGGVDKEIRKHSQKASRVPEGDYLVKILEGTPKESEKTGNRFINWRVQIVKPSKFKGKVVYGMTSLKKEALWNLRNLVHAATGKNIAGKTVDLDLDGLRNKIVGAAIEDDEYEGKVRSRVNTWFPKDEFEEPEDDEEDEDDEDEEEDEEDEDDDEEEDEDEEDEEEEEEKPKKKGKKKAKKKADDDDDDEDDLEEVDVEEI